MAQTTFSGPILAGTIKNTTGTTVGTDMKNTGQVVMAQTFAIDLSSGAIAAEASNVIIPANSYNKKRYANCIGLKPRT